jgi:hypothetical protein
MGAAEWEGNEMTNEKTPEEFLNEIRAMLRDPKNPKISICYNLKLDISRGNFELGPTVSQTPTLIENCIFIGMPLVDKWEWWDLFRWSKFWMLKWINFNQMRK